MWTTDATLWMLSKVGLKGARKWKELSIELQCSASAVRNRYQRLQGKPGRTICAKCGIPRRSHICLKWRKVIIKPPRFPTPSASPVQSEHTNEDDHVILLPTMNTYDKEVNFTFMENNEYTRPTEFSNDDIEWVNNIWVDNIFSSSFSR